METHANLFCTEKQRKQSEINAVKVKIFPQTQSQILRY